MATFDTTKIADWLIDGARSAANPPDVLATLCDRLVDCGIPLWRAAVFVRTLHPNVTGRRFLWRLGHGVDTSELLFEGEDRRGYGEHGDHDFANRKRCPARINPSALRAP